VSDKREKFIELLSPDSKNFLGTGLTLEEFMRLHMAEKVQVSWFNVDRDERMRRLDLVMELCVELKNIEKQTNFSTAICRMAISALIEGDHKDLRRYAEDFTFLHEGDDLRERFAPIFKRFSELLMAAYNTRPGAGGAKA